MAVDPNKNEEQQEKTTPTTETTETTESTSPASGSATTTDEEGGITVSDEQIKLLEDQYANIAQGINDSYKAQENAVNKSYGAQETAMGSLINEAAILRGEKQKLDEKALKREKAYRYIAGLGDAISGVANLVGTAHGAANQTQYYNAPEVVQKAEASRKERKLEMDKLKERLDELSAQKTALRSAKELKLGELSGKKASELATAELQRVKGMGDIYKTNAGNQTKAFTAMVNASARKEAAQTKKTSAAKPGEQYTFYDANGKPTTIPGHKWNKEAALKAYSLIPEERRTKRQKYDRYGDPIKDAYQNPSMTDILYDIAVESETNPELQAYLKALASGTSLGANDPKWK
jgi:hypothetical protein